MLNKINTFFNKHRKAFTVIFVFSLLSYLWLLHDVVDAFFNGTTTVFFSVYIEPGLEAVKETLAGFLIMNIVFPVFPICFIYQILFLILCIKNNKIKNVAINDIEK